MKKDFSAYEREGDKYVYSTFRKDKTTSEMIKNLDKAIDKYTTARAIVPYEGFEKSRIIRKIRDAFTERASMKSTTKGFYAFLSIFALSLTLFLASFNLTGNAIGGITLNDTKWIGACFFLCGLIFAFFYLKNKN